MDGGVPEETLQRLMGTLGNQDGDLVIIQNDQEYAVYNADEAMEGIFILYQFFFFIVMSFS